MQRILIESIDRTSGNENDYTIAFPGGRITRVYETRINSLSFPVGKIANIFGGYNNHFRIFWSDTGTWSNIFIPVSRINNYVDLCALFQLLTNNAAIAQGSAITTTWTTVGNLLIVNATAAVQLDLSNVLYWTHQLLGLDRLIYNFGGAVYLDGNRSIDLEMGLTNLYLFIYGEMTDLGDLVSKHGFEDNALYANIPINIFEHHQQCFIPSELRQICHQTYKNPRDLYSINITWRVRLYNGEFDLVNFITPSNHVIEFLIFQHD